MGDTLFLPVMVAIESDPTRYHGEHPHLPALLNRGDAEQVLAHLASDLAELLPGVEGFNLGMPGALYDQTQLLRPGYPIYDALKALTIETGQSDGASRLLSIGAAQGNMPREDLQPDPDIPPAVLQLLPLLVSGPAESMTALSDLMEHVFLERGQVSPHSAKNLEAQFGISIQHARFMTLTDLNALLRLQLEHFGFLGLWELLDAALGETSDALDVTGRTGQRFRWHDGAVHCRFETFDYWASEGAGQDLTGDAGEMAGQYIDWTREYRQYLVTLAAHAVPLAQHLPGLEHQPLTGSFLVEAGQPVAGLEPAAVTEHMDPELGTVAVTVVNGDEVIHYYPLTAPGLGDLHEQIREDGLAMEGISFPGGLLCDSTRRCLVPDIV